MVVVSISKWVDINLAGGPCVTKEYCGIILTKTIMGLSIDLYTGKGSIPVLSGQLVDVIFADGVVER